MDYKAVKIDENGDEIVLEGIRDVKKIFCFFTIICIFMIVASFGLAIFVLPFFLVAICKNWKLYVTHTDIHYNAGCHYILIPFNDINKISVIPGTSTILIKKKQTSVYQTANGIRITNELRIKYIVNCKEFVEAVRKEMASTQNNF